MNSVGGIGGLEAVIDEELSSFIRGVMDDWSMHGLSMAIVKPSWKLWDTSDDRKFEVEYGSWGVRTEDGEKVTPEVSMRLSIISVFIS